MTVLFCCPFAKWAAMRLRLTDSAVVPSVLSARSAQQRCRQSYRQSYRCDHEGPDNFISHCGDWPHTDYCT
jgi:hypothetical protein